MKTSFCQFAIAWCVIGAAASSFAQYPPSTVGGYRPPVYAPYAQPTQYAQPGSVPQTRGGYPAAAQHAATTPVRGRPQFTASRTTSPGYGLQPSTHGYVAPVAAPMMMPTAQQPAPAPATMPSFRPVNPPSQTTQRILTASRTPTPAPPQVRPASATAQAGAPSAAPMWQPSMNAQDWNAPMPSMPAQGPTNQWGGHSGYSGGSAAPAEGYAGGGCEGGCESGDCGTGCCFCRLRGCCCGLIHGQSCLRSTGDMVQHMPFFGTTHGYYYYRPYHVMHVFSQQELATRWGGDPRNPHDNTMFQRIYEQMGVDAKSTTPTPNTVPSNMVPPSMTPTTPYYPTPATTPTPTPIPSYTPPAYEPQPQAVPMSVSPTPGAPTPAQIELVPSPAP